MSGETLAEELMAATVLASPGLIAELGAGHGGPYPLRLGLVAWQPRQLFDFDDDGDAAMIFLARDSLGRPQDLIAWRLSDDRLARLDGAAAMLGEEELLRPRLPPEEGLRIFRSPRRWLAEGWRGIVPIDLEMTGRRLCNISPLVAEDEDHAKELLKVFTPKLPRIIVEE